MVFIEQFRISDDGLRMYINARVNEASYFSNRYISKVTVMTGDRITEATYNSTPPEGFIYQEVYTEGNSKRRVDLVLTPALCNENFTKPNFSSDLFFLYIECEGVLGDCVPCRLDEKTTVGVTFDDKLLYQKVMNYVKELADTCNLSHNLVDFILLFNAFKAAVETEHFVEAKCFYDKMFDLAAAPTSKPCGCHG